VTGDRVAQAARGLPWDSWRKRLDHLGFHVAIAHRGRAVYSQGFGDDGRGRPPTGRTLFNAQSITKMLTAAAIGRLVDRGRLDLDATVATYLPALEGSDLGAATVAQLLSHTTGITEAPWSLQTGYPGVGLVNYAGRLRFLEAEEPAGELASYNSRVYAAAGAIVERLSGRSYPQFMRSEVFEPLGDAPVADRRRAVLPLAALRADVLLREEGRRCPDAPRHGGGHRHLPAAMVSARPLAVPLPERGGDVPATRLAGVGRQPAPSWAA